MDATYTVRIVEFSEAIPTLPFERYLFNEPIHLQTQVQPDDRVVTFFLLKAEQIQARLTVFLTPEKAISPRRATFGGIETSTNVPLPALQVFVQAVLAEVSTVPFLELRSFPDGLNPELAAHLHRLFMEADFRVTTTELNQHLLVSSLPIEQHLHASTLRRLRKSEREGFTFSEWVEPDWPQVHTFIAESRRRKNRPMTLSLEQLRQSVQQLPGIFRVFTVRQNSILAALIVTVHINNRILYTLYPADDPAFLSSSPLILAYAGLYRLCQREGYELLDLGISTENGERNEGLIRFKNNLGAMESEKRTYTFFFPRK
ncbi:GNAT family N-acetyltransferase [Siphonobacter sp.]|uniref:GNAT family N-acetyltransferase n=1 Tax=Siphonobacter sp. TaxID=1869184 RepID=UPI003B39FD78